MSILEAGTEIKEKQTAGQEFMEWAENIGTWINS